MIVCFQPDLLGRDSRKLFRPAFFVAPAFRIEYNQKQGSAGKEV